MKKDYLVIMFVSAVLLASVWFHFSTKEKTAFVYISQVLEQFERMEHSKALFDTMQYEINHKLEVELEKLNNEKLAYETYKEKLSEKEQIEKERNLLEMQMHCDRMGKELNNETDRLRGKLFNPVIEEVNSFIKEYGKQNGYSYVFGNLGNGNIMYATDDNNITEEVIENLNKQYRELLSKQE